MQKLLISFLSFFLIGNLFSQKDTLILNNNCSKGTVEMITKSNSENHSLQFFRNINDQDPITGVVKINGKKGVIYFNCLNGIPQNDEYIFQNEIVKTIYYSDSIVSKTFRKNIIVKIIKTSYTVSGKVVFIEVKKEKSRIKAIAYYFINNKRKAICNADYLVEMDLIKSATLFESQILNLNL